MERGIPISLLVLAILVTLMLPARGNASIPNDLDVYSAGEVIGKTEYAPVKDVITAVLILETGWFSRGDVTKVTETRLMYFREFNFPTDEAGFYRALGSVPGTVEGKPYAEDKNYIRKVRSIVVRLRK